MLESLILTKIRVFYNGFMHQGHQNSSLYDHFNHHFIFTVILKVKKLVELLNIFDNVHMQTKSL